MDRRRFLASRIAARVVMIVSALIIMAPSGSLGDGDREADVRTVIQAF